jgi:hypothetical protein
MKNKIAIIGVIAGSLTATLIMGVIYGYGFAYGIVVFLSIVGLFTLAALMIGILNDLKKPEPHSKGFGWDKDLE